MGIIANEISLYGRFHNEWYADDIDRLIQFCESQPTLHLPDASDLIYPTRSNSGSGLITSGGLNGHALRTILVQHSNWYQTFKTLYNSKLKGQKTIVVAFGPDRCIPPSILRELESIRPLTNASKTQPETRKPDDIAIVGMSIKVAGADDVAEFWDLLCEAKSQHKEVPPERIKFENAWRELDPNRKWFGNFINDHDAFDQKFFKKNAREAASTDPQQRQMLQVAYQALEQAGYFNSPDSDKKIGCYVGVCAADYENNVACYQPNAYTAVGNLKSFIAGKISHYFGWTGQGLCIDTACSSSLVAVHLACKSILSGECSAALAGGVNVMTNPLWFQNLAAASFLSPTGQCKPFDASADGYCRGEAITAVFLKKMSAAIANGDQILGTISGTAVYQNQNCTPIFVPNAPSLSDLFRDVLAQSKLEPSQITVVEAHGTGTQVGDPAEYDGICQVLGGRVRSKPIAFGSVKGLVGHTECASGAVSLIKTLLMIQQKAIPPQPSYNTLNPHINASAGDNIEIATKLISWNDNFRAALINNYGASGSNASMVVTQAPSLPITNAVNMSIMIEFPFRFYGKDDRALREYSAKFRPFLQLKGSKDLSVANLAFNVSRQSNPTLDRALLLSCRSTDQLAQKLAAFEKGDIDTVSVGHPSPRPVILCFGGQISTYVGLSREVYKNVMILRTHLDQCDAVCRSTGCESIFPGIFERIPIDDPVKLQTMLFAMQYSCAKSWIDCGVQPVAVVGHSFGELTALCISNALSLDDAIKMIAGRANLIKNAWGPEKGSMVATDAELHEIEKLLAETGIPCEEAGERPPTIACFNSPRSFTIAGSSKSIDIVIETITKSSTYSTIRFKRLNVTNAFHSALVEPLMSNLEKFGQGLTFTEPTVHWERATQFQSNDQPTSKYVASHMRDPVYFSHAIQRLSKKYPSCIWLEAGSNSTITNMASRALQSPETFCFQPMNIANDNGLQQLINASVGLWKEGLNFTFWTHHRLQTYEYTPLLLPSYQFEKTRHWMEPKAPPKSEEPVSEQIPEEPKGLWSFVGYQDDGKQFARFRINTVTPRYQEFVSGHVIAQTAPICPATLEVDIAVEALISLCPDFTTSRLQPKIYNVDNQAPICIDPSRSVWLDAQANDASHCNWEWKIVSDSLQNASLTVHVTGRIVFVSVDDAEWRLEFSRYERLIGYHRCSNLLHSDDADDIIQGRNIYRAFGEVVDYAEPYRGLQKLVGKGNESAGRITKKYSGATWLDTHLSDCFGQVGGIWVNCMTDKAQGDMYIATGFEKWMRSPDVGADYSRPDVWDVLGNHHRASDQLFLTDIFIFDSTNSKLMEVILGINYHKVPKASMCKILSRLTVSEQSEKTASVKAEPVLPMANDAVTPQKPKLDETAKPKKKASGGPDVVMKTRALLAEISGLEPDAIQPDAQLADIGIDSLMGMELARELDGMFKCSLPNEELVNVADFSGLVRLIQDTLGLAADRDGADLTEGGNPSESSQSDASSILTPSHTVLTSVSDAEDNTMSDENYNTTKGHLTGSISPGPGDNLELPSSMIIEAFEESKRLTDQFIADYRCAGYIDTVLPKQTQLCVALTVEAFEQLGCPLRASKAGQRLERIEYVPQHQRLAEYLYKMLEQEARLIDMDGSQITRTAITAPSKTSEVILANLLHDYPDHEWANRLVHFAASRLADVLTGKCDGIKLLFGTDEGRELVTGLYGDSLLNKLANAQMQDIITRLASRIPKDKGPLKILELGAGTGGTTKGMAALLAQRNIPVEYTFSDLSGSFVAAARRNFKAYPFMKFRVHDIEKPPANDLLGTQHIIIASNAIHATHSLTESTRNIRKALRPDGFLMMLEMTEPVYWVDLIFGLFEGWWLFEDGRQHAIAHQSVWERDMQSVGYGHVDWTDGHSPEIKIQRIIVALASGPQYSRQPPVRLPAKSEPVPTAARKAAVDDYVRKYTHGFAAPVPSSSTSPPSVYEQSVLITGASGSLGTHLVAHTATLPHVKSVICLNRRSTTKPDVRQHRAMEEKGILFDAACQSKLQVLQTDTSRPMLGLARSEYDSLLNTVTHIIHNAWPMTGKRPLSGMESQFQVMRNLIDFSRDISSRRPKGFTLSFQFISSIAVVGHYPLWSGNAVVPEERVTIESVLPNGYGDAKFICERMLDETLHKCPDLFRTMAVRLGQIAGSKTSGYWNPMEHLSFLMKSSQTLKVLPDFDGDLCWTPVDDVAGTLSDLLLSERTPYPIYHIDNPVRQPWREMIPVLSDALNISSTNVIPFKQWVRRVRSFPGAIEKDNPAGMLIDFLDDNFLRMSCGGLFLSTAKTREHSSTLAAVGPVSAEVARKYIQAWKDMGFLHV